MLSMTGTLVQSPMSYTRASHVSLKAMQCILFLFFNRAQRVLRSESTLTTGLTLSGTALLPIFVSAVLHTAILCPGIAAPTRAGRVAVIYALLHVLLLHACTVALSLVFLQRYTATASFVSVLAAAHLCFAVRPAIPDLVPAQAISYGRVMGVAAYMLPVLCWILLPVLRVHELEAIALLFYPEALCFVFAHALQLAALVLHLVATTACLVAGFHVKNA
jgi:hypothetical protein